MLAMDGRCENNNINNNNKVIIIIIILAEWVWERERLTLHWFSPTQLCNSAT